MRTALAIGFLALVIFRSEAATASPASAFLQSIAEKTDAIWADQSETVEARQRAVEVFIGKRLNVRRMARLSIGRFWPRAPSLARDAYLDAYRRWVAREIAPYLAAFPGETLRVSSEKSVGGGDILAETTISALERPDRSAAFRIRIKGAEAEIIDVNTGGLSLAIANRATFTSLVRRFGLAGLTFVLEARAGRMGVWP